MTTAAGLGPDYDPTPYILPGRIPDRETREGWERWRRTRHDFVPAPSVSQEEYALMAPRRRRLYDLHRTATHANMIFLDTPMTTKLGRIFTERVEMNSVKHAPSTRSGLMVNGGGFQGKTEAVCELAADFADFWLELDGLRQPEPGTRDLLIPVAYVQTPVTAKPKSTCCAILDFYGVHLPSRTPDLPRLTRMVKSCLQDNGTKVLILDDITRLQLHRADDQDTHALIRSLMSMHVTLILIGVNIPGSGLLGDAHYDQAADDWVYRPRERDKSYNPEAEGQHERRFKMITLDQFRYDTDAEIEAWIAHLAGIEEQLRLLNPAEGTLTDGDMPEYLFRRTKGIVGLLADLVEHGCARAMSTGQEVLSRDLLDDIVINLRDRTGRDPGAGEIPDVPAHQPRQRAPGSGRRRNSSFDDAGGTTALGA